MLARRWFSGWVWAVEIEVGHLNRLLYVEVSG